MLNKVILLLYCGNSALHADIFYKLSIYQVVLKHTFMSKLSNAIDVKRDFGGLLQPRWLSLCFSNSTDLQQKKKKKWQLFQFLMKNTTLRKVVIFPLLFCFLVWSYLKKINKNQKLYEHQNQTKSVVWREIFKKQTQPNKFPFFKRI